MNRLLSKSFTENPNSAIQNRKWVGLFALVVALVVSGAVAQAQAQQPQRIPRIAYLSAFDPAREAPRSEAIGWLCASLAT
jgi:hypothetical protein